jgi:hypothetical protein
MVLRSRQGGGVVRQAAQRVGRGVDGIAAGLEELDLSGPAGAIGPRAVLKHDGGLRSAATGGVRRSGPGRSDRAGRNQQPCDSQDHDDQHEPHPGETHAMDDVHCGLPFLLLRCGLVLLAIRSDILVVRGMCTSSGLGW